MNSEERAERNWLAAVAVQVEGLTVEQAANKFNLPESIIRSANLKKHRSLKARLDRIRRQRAEKHRQIARAMRDEDLTVSAAAARFGVQTHEVREACEKHGVTVTVPENRRRSVETLEIIADLAHGKPVSEIVRERQLSRQRIHQIKRKGEAAGLLPLLPRLDKLLAENRSLRARLDEYEREVANRRARLASGTDQKVKRAAASFGARLRECRKAAGLTQATAAALAGLPASKWTAYEIGKQVNPRLNKLINMAAALGVEVNDLLDGLSATPTPTKARRGARM